MTDPKAEATGTAHDMTIAVENNVPALEAALAHAREVAKSQFYYDQVDRMQSKVERARADLAAAEESLANAQAELAVEVERLAGVQAEQARLAAMSDEDRAAAIRASQDQAEAARIAWRAEHAAATKES